MFRLSSLVKRSFAFEFDLAILGGGPGGYVAAIQAAQRGLKTVCIEKRDTLGGTCLNVGCIPAKSLLNSSHKYMEARDHFQDHGVLIDNLRPDLPQMMNMKKKAITGLTKGIEGLFKKYGVKHVKGEGKFVDTNTLQVGNREYSATKLIIATGSQPQNLPGGILPIDEKRVLSSTGAMELENIPQKMTVVGGGVIGLELGSVYSRLGTEVTVVEFLPRIAPGFDLESAKALQKVLEKQGIKFLLGAKVTGGAAGDSGVRIELQPADASVKDLPSTLESEYVLVAVGRRAFTQGLGLDFLDITRDKLGRINVNEHLQTHTQPHIFAIGDCAPGPMLAHKAEEEASFVIDRITRNSPHINYNAIPSVIYTFPELAGVGKTEEQLKEKKVEYNKGLFTFMANSRARANHDTDGFVKVLAHKHTDKLLGVHIVGSVAGEIIMEAALGIAYGATSEDLARTCHAHPGFGEALKEACLSAYDKPIHSQAQFIRLCDF